MIAYRAATEADFEFLYRLHRETMRVYAEETYGPWDETWQRSYFQRHFNPDTLRLITVDGEVAGALQVQYRTEEIFLACLEIAPPYQGRGIGTAVMRQLMDEADRASKPVALRVLKSNRRARSLYQRLGFGVTGENETHYIMAYEK